MKGTFCFILSGPGIPVRSFFFFSALGCLLHPLWRARFIKSESPEDQKQHRLRQVHHFKETNLPFLTLHVRLNRANSDKMGKVLSVHRGQNQIWVGAFFLLLLSINVARTDQNFSLFWSWAQALLREISEEMNTVFIPAWSLRFSVLLWILKWWTFLEDTGVSS